MTRGVGGSAAMLDLCGIRGQGQRRTVGGGVGSDPTVGAVQTSVFLLGSDTL